MYVSITEVIVHDRSESEVAAHQAALYAEMRPKAGFRWAMLLKSLDEPDTLASVTMWLSREQSQNLAGNVVPTDEPMLPLEYDVATARGSMTPASFAAIVDWEVDSDNAAPFVNRWNAVYHAIEDKLGSRLLLRLNSPGIYSGLHMAQSEEDLKAEILGAPVSDGETMMLGPTEMERYEVLVLTEA